MQLRSQIRQTAVSGPRVLARGAKSNCTNMSIISEGLETSLSPPTRRATAQHTFGASIVSQTQPVRALPEIIISFPTCFSDLLTASLKTKLCARLVVGRATRPKTQLPKQEALGERCREPAARSPLFMELTLRHSL